MERPQKLARLGKLRQKLPFISQQALSTLLHAAESEDLPAASSRNDIRAARDVATQQLTPYGPLHQKMRVASTNSQPLDLEIQHPAAMLHYICSHSKCFSDLISRTFEKNPSSPSSPWRLVLYTDEILPGNQLAYKTARKLWGVYWSILELGIAALSDEDCSLKVFATSGHIPQLCLLAYLGLATARSSLLCFNIDFRARQTSYVIAG